MRRLLLALSLAAGCAQGETPASPAPGPAQARVDPWQRARERGIDFRAIGQEPGWMLEIDSGRELHLVYDYAEREARLPTPAPVTTGATTTYDAGRLRVVIDERPCQDVMSGEPFARSVTVTIDGRELVGCGRVLAP